MTLGWMKRAAAVTSARTGPAVQDDVEPHYLQSHDAPRPVLPCPEDDSHAPATNLFEYLVSGECRGRLRQVLQGIILTTHRTLALQAQAFGELFVLGLGQKLRRSSRQQQRINEPVVGRQAPRQIKAIGAGVQVGGLTRNFLLRQ